MKKSISIITVNLNNRTGLKETIKSVLEQSYRDFEYIVIDGGSSDGSVEEIRSIEADIDYWHSKPDGGIYDAMNQGLKVASGEYIHFLNSGDIYNDQSVLGEFQKLKNNSDIVHGYIVVKNNLKIKSGVVKKITKRYLCNYTIKHPGAFVRSDLFNRIGYFDESFRIAGDYDFFLRAIFKYQSTTSFIDLCVARFDINGISNSNEKLLNSERKRARENNIDLISNFLCRIMRAITGFIRLIILKTNLHK